MCEVKVLKQQLNTNLLLETCRISTGFELLKLFINSHRNDSQNLTLILHPILKLQPHSALQM